MIKTAELDPDGRYILCYAPHGILTFSAFVCFDTEATGFAVKFPGIDLRPLTLTINFRLPLIREFLLSFGICDVSKASCLKILRKGSGSAILLAVGGANESLYSSPGTYDLVLRKRKGFVKLALETGASLVPVIAFGENDLYYTNKPRPGGKLETLQRVLKKYLGFTMPNFYGDGILFGRGLMPQRKPVSVVVGAPMAVPKSDPKAMSQEAFHALVDEYHAKYVSHLYELWNRHKDVYAADRRKSLTLVE